MSMSYEEFADTFFLTSDAKHYESVYTYDNDCCPGTVCDACRVFIERFERDGEIRFTNCIDGVTTWPTLSGAMQELYDYVKGEGLLSGLSISE